MYDKVVIPTDGSDNAERGVEEGLEMARTLGVKALAIYVVNASEYEGLHQSSIRESAKTGMMAAGEKALEGVKELADDLEVELEAKVLEGKPYRKICGAADDTDIIYISSHGLSGFTRLFMGSTTERVLKNAEATVAVVKGKYTHEEEMSDE